LLVHLSADDASVPNVWRTKLALFRTPQATSPAGDVSPVEHANEFSIKKADHEQQLVFGEVYAPGFPDSQGDYMDAEGMKKSALGAIDVGHDQQDCGAYIVESFIAQDGDPTFIPGSWVIGVHIPDPALWSQVKKGELNGFSLDGLGIRKDKPFVFDMPDTLTGQTEEAHGHFHTFTFKIGPKGEISGETNVVDGHMHFIRHGTHTSDSAGHSHRFSFVEGILNHGQAGSPGH